MLCESFPINLSTARLITRGPKSQNTRTVFYEYLENAELFDNKVSLINYLWPTPAVASLHDLALTVA